MARIYDNQGRSTEFKAHVFIVDHWEDWTQILLSTMWQRWDGSKNAYHVDNLDITIELFRSLAKNNETKIYAEDVGMVSTKWALDYTRY